MADSILTHGFHAYSAWRAALRDRIETYRGWLAANELADAQTDLRLQQLLARLADDRLVVAFVAEVPRGKSELINAIFFAEYGQRLLPASAGRPTLCTTELLYDRSKPPCIELLPTQTRARHASSFEFKRFPEEWHVLRLDTDSADSMREEFAHLRDTMRVPAEEARRYGLCGPGAARPATPPDGGTVEVPRWRHAVISFPHPLLEQGLVVLDTPGMAGSTHAAQPDADVVLLILAADSGVTDGDLAIWREQTARAPGRSCLAVLNKIDALWGFGSEAQIEAQIARRRQECSRLLGLDPSCVISVSAQQGLQAKISGDAALLERSGLPRLEHALAAALIPARHEIMGSFARAEIGSIMAATRARLEARRRNVLDRLRELEYLRGKNRGMVAVMMEKVGVEKGRLERTLSSYQALRSVFSAHTNRLFTHLGMDALAEDWRLAREQMRTSVFTAGVRLAMSGYFRDVRDRLERSSLQVAEISTLMAAMYRKFSQEHGLRLPTPTPFSMLKYVKEIDRLEAIYERRFNTLLAMLANEKSTLMQKFFETLASRVKRCYEYANREADQWLGAVMAPMEMQVDEHQTQFMRRLESIKRIHRAIHTLDDRMEELLVVERGVRAQIEALAETAATLDADLASAQIPLAQAA